MTYKFHISAEAEPAELHGLSPKDTQVFSAHLSLEAREEDEAVARTETEAFLASLADVSFHLVKLPAAIGPGQVVATVDTLNPKSFGPHDEIFAWLEAAKEGFADLADQRRRGAHVPVAKMPPNAASTQFYSRPKNNQTDVASFHSAGAFDLMRSTAKWPAPLAQNAGLMRAVKVDYAFVAGTEYALVYTRDGEKIDSVDLKATHTSNGATQVELSLGITPDIGDPIVRNLTTTQLAAYDATEMQDRNLQSDGSYSLEPYSEELGRLLVRIEEQAPTLLWAAPTLGGMALDPGFATRLAGLASVEELTDDTKLPASILHWVKLASATSLLDVMIAGLLLPVENAEAMAHPGDLPPIPRQSTVLQRLSRRITGFFEDEIEQTGAFSDIDEAKVYSALHTALWRNLNGITQADIWDQLFSLVPSDTPDAPETLKTLKPLIGAPWPAPKAEITWAQWKEELVALSGDIAELMLVLEGEEGGENWLLDRFGETYLDKQTDEFQKDILLDTGVSEPSDALAGATAEEVKAAQEKQKKFRKDLRQIYQDFTDEIAGPFDAAEAMRRDFGADVLSAIVQPNTDPTQTLNTYQRLIDMLPEREVFQQRFGIEKTPGTPLPAVSPFAEIYAPCLKVGLGGNPTPEHRAVLLETLSAHSKRRLQELVAQTPSTSVFRPDATPQPLRIPLMRNLKPSEADEIAQRTSGLGFLIKASFADRVADGAAHVNLIQVSHSASSVDRFVTVEPTLPLSTPGAASLYLPYDGQPVSSPSRARPGDGSGQPSQAEQNALNKIMGYHRAEARYEENPTDGSSTTIQAPELSYGAYYDVTGFWVPVSGSLPVGLRPDDDHPYQPANPALGGPFAPDVANREIRYQRRTTIAQTTLSGIQGARPLAQGIHPLGLDDPRLAITQLKDGVRYTDLYRHQDGTGILETGRYELWFLHEGEEPAGGDADRTQLTLFGVDTGGLDLNALEVRLMGAPDDKSDPVALDPPMILPARPTGRKISFEVDEGARVWVRLSLANAAKPGVVAFDDPSDDRAQDRTGRTASLVVLAPQVDNWTEDQTRKTTFTLPGVSFSDLERWASNLDLWAETTGLSRDKAQKRLNWLRTAHALFEALPGAENRAYADKMNALPDPAVTGYVVSVGIADALNRTGLPPDGRCLERFIPFSPYSVKAWKPGEFPDPLDTEVDWEKVIKDVKQSIDILCAAAKFDLTLHGGTEKGDDGEERSGLEWLDKMQGNGLLIPAGSIAHLWATPAVRASLFDQDSTTPTTGIFDTRIKDLSCGTYRSDTDYVLFDGAKLVIEVMDTLEDGQFNTDPIVARVSGTARGYQVLSNLTRDERIFSEMELITQRWRPSGQPLYSYIDPAPGPTRGPVILVSGKAGRTLEHKMPQKLIDHDQISDFEAEAFVGRQASDGERTRVRLNPAPDVTFVWQFDWPEHSATYLRHAAVLRSRYAAGYTKGDQTRTTHNKDGAFILRIAVLADVTGQELTRPQLRAHLPIQRRLDEDSITPPVACVLNEPPNAQLGLADRICAEVVLTNVYKITEGDRKLKLDQLRKEIGPDPRLSYFPIDDSSSLRCRIAVEGPVGLHFDGPQTTAPAFANCQYMLHLLADGPLEGADLAELEESFAGISLTRYADPGWTWQRPDAGRALSPVKDDVWVTPLSTFKLTDNTSTLLRVHDGALEAARTAVYEDGGKDYVSVAPFEGIQGLLVKPLDDTRLRVSIFGHGHSATSLRQPGTDNRPALIGSIILRIQGDVTLKGATSPKTLRQSDATFARWVRTGRDMGRLVSVSKGGVQTPVPVPELRAYTTGKRISLGDGIVTSPVAQRRYPLHVHRRLVHLLRKNAPQIGAPVALFDQALLADGNGSALAQDRKDGNGVQAETLVLAELETRASILRVRQASVIARTGDTLAGYETAALDLLGSRIPDTSPTNNDPGNKSERHLRLHIRGANQDIALNNLVLKLIFNDSTQTLAEFDLKFEDSDAESSLDVVICSKTDGLVARIRKPGRGFDDETVLGIDSSVLAEAETLSITLENGAISETWADVSVLQSRKLFDIDNPDAFDFDWVFSADGAELPLALNAASLNGLLEAQARFVGLTEPLIIQN